MTFETPQDFTAILADMQEQIDDLTATVERLLDTQQRQQEQIVALGRRQ